MFGWNNVWNVLYKIKGFNLECKKLNVNYLVFMWFGNIILNVGY